MAIALDTSTRSSITTGTSITWAHTVTGSDTMGFAGAAEGGTSSDLLTGITWNGSAMTAAGTGKVQVPADAWVYLYYVVAPTTGNIVASFSGTVTDAYGYGASYTGAKQTGQPDGSTTNTGSTINSLTTSVTTTADNSWGVLIGGSSNYTLGADTGYTERQASGATGGIGSTFGDSNGPKTPAGSLSLAIKRNLGNTNIGAVMATFSPSGGGAAPAQVHSNLLLMGVG